MTVTELMGGVKLISTPVFHDYRGSFSEVWKVDWNADMGIDFVPVQVNSADSTRAFTMRGMHSQYGAGAVAKLVKVTAGSIIDLFVDARTDSPTFGQWQAVPMLDSTVSIYIPPGFYHGYITLTDKTTVNYIMDSVFRPELECGLSYESAPENFWSNLGLYPEEFIISNRDLGHPAWADAIKFLPTA